MRFFFLKKNFHFLWLDLGKRIELGSNLEILIHSLFCFLKNFDLLNSIERAGF